MNINVIPQSVTRLAVFETPLKKLEFCCRTSYKSQGKIKEGSDLALFKLIFTNKHLSVLEHVWIYLDLNPLYANTELGKDIYFDCKEIFETLMYHPHFKKYAENGPIPGSFILNLRTLVELYAVSFQENWLLKRLVLKFFGYEAYTMITKNTTLKEHFLENSYAKESPDYHTFNIVTNRAIANEIVRHRQLSFTQESTRYVDMKKECNFIQPDGLEGAEKIGVWKGLCRSSLNTYIYLRESGVKPQIARDVLPLSLATEIVCTGTTDMWKSFVKLREESGAHPQIRWIAKEIKKYI